MARRNACGLSISAAADAAGINRMTWSSIEAGDRDTEDYIIGRVERALGWAPGSAARVLAGGRPEALDLDSRQVRERLSAERTQFEQKELRQGDGEDNLASYEVRLAEIVNDTARPEWMRKLATAQLAQIREQLQQAQALLDADNSYLAAEKDRRAAG